MTCHCLGDKTMNIRESYWTKIYLKISRTSSCRCTQIARCLRYKWGSFIKFYLFIFGYLVKAYGDGALVGSILLRIRKIDELKRCNTPNLKEEVGDSIPSCEISFLRDRKITRWSIASCALELAYRFFVYLKKRKKRKKKKKMQHQASGWKLPIKKLDRRRFTIIHPSIQLSLTFFFICSLGGWA